MCMSAITTHTYGGINGIAYLCITNLVFQLACGRTCSGQLITLPLTHSWHVYTYSAGVCIVGNR